jgi:putative aldouronate transport system permease protein
MYNFFSADVGLINGILVPLGFHKVDVYANPAAWPVILVVLYVWKSIGYGSVLYLSAIMGIDQECYEAASIDGCNIYKRIRYITLPLLKPTIIILILLALGGLMRGQFDMIYNLVGNNTQLFNITDNIDTLVFKSLMWSQNFGMASAGAFYQSVLCFTTILIVNGIARKVEKDYALF